jgi:hypothetical protein
VTASIPRGRDELVRLYRQTSPWHQAVSDALALIVEEMRVTAPTKETAEMLELSDKRIYQLLGGAKDVRADPQRMRRAGAVAGLIENEQKEGAAMSGWQWCGNVQPHAIHGECPGVTESIPTTDENGMTIYYDPVHGRYLRGFPGRAWFPRPF